MKQFQGGWIWTKNLNESTNQILPLLENTPLEKMQKIADFLNGEILPWQIFDDTLWVFRVTPLPDFILLYVFNFNEEFGSALKIFFYKTSLKVPTEDAYVWAEYYLEFLGILAKHGIEAPIIMDVRDELISLPELLDEVDPKNKDKIWNDIIGQREVPLLKIDKKTAEQISNQLNVTFLSGKFQEKEIQWGLKFALFKNFSIILALSQDFTKFEAYYTKNVLKFQTRRILFFTWLYCNAIIREARTILGDALPKLSDYL